MNLIRNHKGISLPIILGIILFVVSSTIILITSSYNYALLQETDFRFHEEYVNAQNAITATDKIIVRDQNLDSVYLADLAQHMNVDISQYSDNIYVISKTLSNDQVIKSYLQASAGGVTTINLVDSLFQYSGIESGFELNPLIQPSYILSSYLNEFMVNTFPSLNYDENFDNFTDIFTYFETLAGLGTTYSIVPATTLSDQSNPTVNGHWFVNESLTLGNYKDLTIPAGYLLFINGDLTVGRGCTISGNVVVNGNVNINSRNTIGTLEGTVYLSGAFTSNDFFYLGTSVRPAFVFSDGPITLGLDVIGYGYFLGSSFWVESKRTNIDITGGVYSPSITNIDATELQAFPGLDTGSFYTYGITENIEIGSGGSSTDFLFTPPK